MQFDNNLPPGLRGFLAGQGANQRADMQNIGLLSGMMQLQNMQEASQFNQQMQPLQLAQLRASVDQANQVRDIKRGLLSQMAGPQPGGQDALAAESVAGGMPGPTNAVASRMPQQGVLSGGVGGGVPPQVRLGLLSGDPGLIADAKAWIETNKPIAAREGAPVINPSNGQIVFYAPKLEAGMNPQFEGGRVTGVSNIPGYVPAMNQRTQSTEDIKAGMDLVNQPVMNAAGAQTGTFPMSRLDVLRGSKPGPRPPAVAGAPTLSDIPYIPQAEQQRVAGNMDAGLKPDGSGPAIPSSTVLGAPSPAAAAAQHATASGRAESGVKFEDTVLQGGRQGRSNLTTLQLIAPDLEKLPTGPAYNAIVNAKSYLAQFGLSNDPNLGPAQATRALLNQLALKVRSPAGGEGMPGAMSDPDREFLVASINGLDKLPDGNRRLMDIFMTLEQRKIEEASIVNGMRRANMGSEEIRNALNQYANDRPIRKMLKYGR